MKQHDVCLHGFFLFFFCFNIIFRHLLVSLALFDSLFLIFGTFEVTPMNIQLINTSSIFNKIYTKMVLYFRMFASTFYKASIL